MRLLSSYSLIGASSAGILAMAACGGISDPSKTNEGTVATITGALTGADSVPANAHVALVWRVANTGKFEVGADAAVVNGAFTMNLAAPSASYLSETEAWSSGNSSDAYASGGSASEDPGVPPSTDAHPPVAADAGAPPVESGSTSTSNFDFASRLAPRDQVGGQISKPLQGAFAGFIVYVDTNGNGKLDIDGQYAKSSDQVIGGNSELALAYFRDGGTLDYEKMRDKYATPTSLPKAGYNLVWSEGERWLALSAVDLKLSTTTKLPGAVCTTEETISGGSAPTVDDVAPSLPTTGAGADASAYDYGSNPPSTIECAPDGRSYTTTTSYSSYPCGSDSTPTPTPEGLCAPSYRDEPAIGCATGPTATGGYTETLPDGQDPPAGWPCPIAMDGGAPTFDASVPNP
jgi:hypothetical protein